MATANDPRQFAPNDPIYGMPATIFDPSGSSAYGQNYLPPGTGGGGGGLPLPSGGGMGAAAGGGSGGVTTIVTVGQGQEVTQTINSLLPTIGIVAAAAVVAIALIMGGKK